MRSTHPGLSVSLLVFFCVCVCVCVCVSVRLHICLSLCLFVCLSAYLSIHLLGSPFLFHDCFLFLSALSSSSVIFVSLLLDRLICPACPRACVSVCQFVNLTVFQALMCCPVGEPRLTLRPIRILLIQWQNQYRQTRSRPERLPD